jgi:hypothetical protein
MALRDSQKQAKNGRTTLSGSESISGHLFTGTAAPQRELRQLKSIVCHHDTLFVRWTGHWETSQIYCSGCSYIYWDRRSCVSFEEALSEIMGGYREV